MIQKQFIINGALDLDALQALTQPPPLFEEGTVEFWTDPYIAQQMLATHLDPNIEAASRRPEIIEKTVNWIVGRLGLRAGDTLLDLGCGPGLYCCRFAKRGLQATGVDFSENSIRYAREHDPATEYICQNYLALEYAAQFAAVTLIYGDFCVLPDDKRQQLLGIVQRALKPRGYFVFDVSTRAHHQQDNNAPEWSVAGNGGFWSPRPHLVLEQHFDYPQNDVALAQYIVIEANGNLKVYRNWFHYYSAESIAAILENQGFAVKGIYADLTGAPYNPLAEWLGIVAQKR